MANPPLEQTSDVVKKLRCCDFFRGAPQEFTEQLATKVELVSVNSGTQIITKGEQGDTMYMIGKGAVEVHDGEAVMHTLVEGELFGEISALVSEVRTASVRAVTDCLLYRLDQKTLYDTLSTHVQAYRSVIDGLCHRGRDMAEDARDGAVRVRLFEHELAIGKKIQAGFLPQDLPKLDNWEIASHFQSAREVAGDFYDVFEIGGMQRVALFVGDVCGKGVGAALFMTLFRSLLRSNLLLPTEQESSSVTVDDRLGHAIVATNRYIATTHGSSSMFASVFLALFDPASGDISYINGGHEPPLIISNVEVDRFDITGPALGLFANARYEVGHARLEPGQLLFVYTDGVSEAMDQDRSQFGEERILAALQGQMSATTAVHSVSSAIREFAGQAEQHDDITMLALRRII